MMHGEDVGEDEEEHVHAQGENDTNLEAAQEDDSLLFEFDQRRNPAVTVPPQMVHHHLQQPPISTVDVNLEELHREEQNRLMNNQRGEENEHGEEWSL